MYTRRKAIKLERQIQIKVTYKRKEKKRDVDV